MDMIMQHICKSYGSRSVLSDFSCRIPQGSICAVMAPSGAGKTTLLRLMMELEKPDSGTISGFPDRKSVLFQEDRLCPGLSIESNIRMAVPQVRPGDMDGILRELGLQDSARKEASALSGGMARRAALARALLAPGDLLILDEPFTGLDESNRLTAAQTILRHRRGRTLVFVTHQQLDLTLLNADRCIEL